MNSTTNAAMDATARHLESYDFPMHLIGSTNSSTTATTMEDYKSVRDMYLQRKLWHDTLQRVTSTFDASTQSFLPANDEISAEEKQELDQRRQHVFSMLSNKALLLQQKRLELNAKYAHFQQRREEFIRLKQLQQDDSEEEVDDGMYDVTMEYEQELLVQEGKINKLNERRAEIQAHLQSVQQRNATVLQDTDQRKSQLRVLISESNNKENHDGNGASLDILSDFKMSDVLDVPQQQLQELQKKNVVMSQKLEKFVEIKNFYANIRQLLEELSGIRFKNITNNASSSSNTTHDDSGVTLNVQLLEKYDIEIVLDYTVCRSSNNIKNECVIHSATIVSDNTLVTGSRLHGTKSSRSTDSEPCFVQLPIPNFDDIVSLANTYAPGEGLRVLLREVLARITMIETRVQALTLLQNEMGIVATIGPLCTASSTTTSNEHGTMMHDQEVVCSLNHPPMTTVLRMTGNCPLMDGSIYIDQLIGLGGWDTQVVDRIRDTIAQSKYRTPMQIIAALQKEVQRLQDEEQFVVPSTPRIPNRFQFE